MLPQTQQFRDSLSALRVQSTQDMETDDRHIILIDGRPFEKPIDGLDKNAFVVGLTQESDAPVPLNKLLDYVGDELFAQQHPYTSPRSDLRASLASKILGLSVLTCTKTHTPSESLTLWLSRMSIARVAQWVIFDSPHRNVSGATRFGEFSYAPINMPMLESRCRRAGSSFFEEHGSKYQGKLSICRDSRRVTVLEIGTELPKASGGKSADKLLHSVVDSYYSEVARAEQSLFVADLESQQAVYGAAGMVTFRSGLLTHTEGFTDWITIFTRDEKTHGWVTGGRTVMQIPLPFPEQINTALNDLKQNLGLHDWQTLPLDQSIQTFCHYLNAARDHYTEGRTEEAVLHLLFSLEMLLGGLSYDASSADVVERLACVVSSTTKRGFYDVVDYLKRCYKMRNRYVHGGGKGDAIDDSINAEMKDNFRQLSEWASIVLGVALFSRKQTWCQGTDAYGSWLNRIEGVRKKCVSRIEPDTDEIASLGLNRIEISGGFVNHLLQE